MKAPKYCFFSETWQVSKFLFPFLFLLLFTTSCAAPQYDSDRVREIPAAFRLTDGTSISRPDTEEYNPILLRTTGGRLVLLYASNYKPAGCPLCTPGKHNLFITLSENNAPYTTLGQLPPFEQPQVITWNATPFNKTNRFTFTAYLSGNSITIYVNNPYETNAKAGLLSLSLTNLPYTISDWQVTSNTTHENLQIIGLSVQNHAIGRNPNTTAVYIFDPQYTATPLQEIPEMHGATSATFIPAYHTGFENSYFLVQQNSLIAARQNQVYGAHTDLIASLNRQGLTLTDAYAYHEYGDGSRDILVLAARNTTSDDLYAVTSHNLRALWGMVAPYGN